MGPWGPGEGGMGGRLVTGFTLCPQGRLATRLQDTSAPEFVHIIFKILDSVSQGRVGGGRGEQGGTEGRAEVKRRQARVGGRGQREVRVCSLLTPSTPSSDSRHYPTVHSKHLSAD